jgi:hypothetical protein
MSRNVKFRLDIGKDSLYCWMIYKFVVSIVVLKHINGCHVGAKFNTQIKHLGFPVQIQKKSKGHY